MQMKRVIVFYSNLILSNYKYIYNYLLITNKK